MNEQKVIVDACCKIPNAHVPGRSSTGKAACGVLIIDAYGQEYEFAKYLGVKTNNQAEFEGLIFALDKACEVLNRQKAVEVWMDSDLVINWMNKVYRMRKEHIKPLFDEANLKAQRLAGVSYFHHPRETLLAQRADKLANAEFDLHNK